jgi:hypothetical protein
MRFPDGGIRYWVNAALLGCASCAGAVPAPSAAPAPAPAAPAAAADLGEAARALDGAVRGWLDQDVARDDGHVYGMDVAPLLLYAAERRDTALYGRLRPEAEKLIVAGGEAATDGFVLWRHKDGAAPEVSGATEALWLARALWTGARAFQRPDDRALAGRILAGYARHAAERHGTWLVRKYYAFSTGSYASLSVLPNYQPDFVANAAGASATLKSVAQRSYTTIQRAVTPSKLPAPLIQPDVGALFPDLGVHRYAPNDAVSLDDACAGAEGSQRGLPEVAHAVLAFAGDKTRRDANGRLYGYFHRVTGAPVGELTLSSTGYACLARLAVALKDATAAARLGRTLAGDMAGVAAAPDDAARLYAAGPLLRAAHALRAFD